MRDSDTLWQAQTGTQAPSAVPGVQCGTGSSALSSLSDFTMGKRPAPAKADASSEKKAKPEAKPVQEDPTSEFSAALTQRQA